MWFVGRQVTNELTSTSEGNVERRGKRDDDDAPGVGNGGDVALMKSMLATQ